MQQLSLNPGQPVDMGFSVRAVRVDGLAGRGGLCLPGGIKIEILFLLYTKNVKE